MRPSILLLLLGAVGSLESSELPDSSGDFANEITVRIGNSSFNLPDYLVLVPAVYTLDQRKNLFHKMGHDVKNDLMTSSEKEMDINAGVDAVLQATLLILKTSNVTGIERGSALNNNTAVSVSHIYVVEYLGRKRYARKGRSVGLNQPLVRVRRAFSNQWHDFCDPCRSMSPQQPLVVNIIKTGSGCGDGCSPQNIKPLQCGHPHCGPSFHPHPPPPPPPHFYHHHPPPPPHAFHHPPPFNPQPVYHHPVAPARPAYNPPQQPSPSATGSFSQSSASASAQSSSFAWNG